MEELNLDWTATQELADALMREHNVPFRIGHHYASELVGYARQNGLTPLDFPYEKAKELYETMMEEEGHPDSFPFSKVQFFDILNPATIIKNRATKGGPQPAEMIKMLAMNKGDAEAQQKWINIQTKTLADAEKKLNGEFNKLL